MPVPCPVTPKHCWDFEEGKIILSWKYQDERHIYYSEIFQITNRDMKNPYKEINEYYFDLIQKYNLSNRLLFVPIIHPILDTDEYLESIIQKLDPVAIKIHSVGTVCSPKDIRESYTNVLKKYDIPIIVLTDYNNGYFDDKTGVKEAVEAANALDWFNYFDKNKIGGTLNHGATLNIEVLKKVNESNYVMVGIEPSIYFGGNYGRLNIDKDIYNNLGFLKTLKEYLLSTKLIFDVDYDYNRTKEHDIDYQVVSRIKETWNNDDLDRILFKNALKQYPKILNKIKGE